MKKALALLIAMFLCVVGVSGIANAEDKISIETLMKLSKLGLAEAQYELAQCYEHGRGVEQNYSAAKEWYGKACLGSSSRTGIPHIFGCEEYNRLKKAGY